MPLNLNGVAIENATFNGTALDKIVFNGVTVWERAGDELAFYYDNLIPQMTTNAAPYGYADCTRATNASHYPYKAFNGNDTSSSEYWSYNLGSSRTYTNITYPSGTVQVLASDKGVFWYNFQKEVWVDKITFLPCASSGTYYNSTIYFELYDSDNNLLQVLSKSVASSSMKTAFTIQLPSIQKGVRKIVVRYSDITMKTGGYYVCSCCYMRVSGYEIADNKNYCLIPYMNANSYNYIGGTNPENPGTWSDGYNYGNYWTDGTYTASANASGWVVAKPYMAFDGSLITRELNGKTILTTGKENPAKGWAMSTKTGYLKIDLATPANIRYLEYCPFGRSYYNYADTNTFYSGVTVTFSLLDSSGSVLSTLTYTTGSIKDDFFTTHRLECDSMVSGVKSIKVTFSGFMFKQSGTDSDGESYTRSMVTCGILQAYGNYPGFTRVEGEITGEITVDA